MQRRAPDLVGEPIPRLVRGIAVPASVGFLFQTMYNVVDTYWAGRVSTTALAALSLSFPVFFIILAVGGGLQTGATALIGSALGRGNADLARRYAAQTLLLGLVAAPFMSALGLLLSPWLFGLLGAQGQYLDDCLQFMNVIFAGSIFFWGTNLCNAPLNASGDTSTFRNFLIISCVMNFCLDPWFLYGGLGLPAMGLRGLGLATILVQAVGCLYLGRAVHRLGLPRLDALADFRPDAAVMLEIVRQGLPSVFNFLTMSLGIFVILAYVADFGPQAVAAYGAAVRLEQIALLPTIGLNVATLALSAQNYGCGDMQRVRHARTTALRYGAWLMFPAGLPLFFFGRTLMTLFTADPVVADLGGGYLRMAALLLYAYVVLYVCVSSLQGVGRPMFALWIGLARQLLVPMALFPLLLRVLHLGPGGVWWGIFGINATAAVVSYVYSGRVLARLRGCREGTTGSASPGADAGCEPD